MRQGFKAQAEKIALRQRQLLGLPNEAPLSPFQLAEQMEVTVLGPRDVPDLPVSVITQLLSVDPESWSATTIVRNDCTLIIHNTKHSIRRQHSNLMHELAHILCNHRPSQLILSKDLPFALRSYDAEQEEEATWLGACLQIPRDALLWAILQGMDNSQICARFVASPALVQYRRQTTGVDIQIRRRQTPRPK